MLKQFVFEIKIGRFSPKACKRYQTTYFSISTK